MDSFVLGSLAYIYAKPTTLLEFLASGSPLAIELKRKHFSKVFEFQPGIGKKVLLEVDSISDYDGYVHYFLGFGLGPGVCITYAGSPLLLGLSRERTKIIELSITAERIAVSKDETIVTPLLKKNTHDLLKLSLIHI